MRGIGLASLKFSSKLLGFSLSYANEKVDGMVMLGLFSSNRYYNIKSNFDVSHSLHEVFMTAFGFAFHIITNM